MKKIIVGIVLLGLASCNQITQDVTPEMDKIHFEVYTRFKPRFSFGGSVWFKFVKVPAYLVDSVKAANYREAEAFIQYYDSLPSKLK